MITRRAKKTKLSGSHRTSQWGPSVSGVRLAHDLCFLSDKPMGVSQIPRGDKGMQDQLRGLK